MKFTEEIIKKQKMVNDYLDKLMQIHEAPEIIIEGMKYSVTAGGKRIRPILALSICSGLGGNIEDAMPLACSIELIHTYSLIHDDLPAMDNDDLRRGKPTNHKVYGEANAILAGDALLNYAFECIFDTIEKNNYQPRFVKCGSIIAKAAGVTGMIGGQVTDIESEGKDMDLQQLIKMHRMKTGALIEAAC
jgi:geranylgeranyl diphosphate synthase type II